MVQEHEPTWQRQRLTLDDAHAVDVRRAGPDEGRPLVLVHGIGVSGDYFLPFARVLARQRPVVMLDLPGYGLTPTPPRPLDIPALAAAALEALARLGVTDRVLVGQSMGCQVVVDALAADPGGTAGYVLIGPTVDPDARNPLRIAARLALDMARETPANNLVVLQDYVRMGPLRYLATTAHMLADRIEEGIGACHMPGLVIRGGRDPIAPARWVSHLAALAPDAALAEVDGAAHNVQHTHPEELARACAPFLSRVAAT